MLLPEEVEAKATIPALRAMVARRLVNRYGLTQQRVACLLGVTQASVSNYLREVRGSTFKIEETPRIGEMLDDIARQLVEGADKVITIAKFHEACRYIKSKRLMCVIHQKLEPALEIDKCHVCDIAN